MAAAEPLIDIAYFNTLFSTPDPSSGQRASRFACNEVKAVYAGEGTAMGPDVRIAGPRLLGKAPHLRLRLAHGQCFTASGCPKDPSG